MNDGRIALEQRIGHVFTDQSLLDGALTHRSARGRHNERLEFLGDAVLGLVVAEALYRGNPELQEGDLSRMRAALVRAETLAEVASELGLGELVILGPGEMKSGGHRRGSILGDAVEAIVGAVYLDGGFAAARDVVLRMLATRLASPPDPDTLKDSKTRLQELLQGQQMQLPTYDLIESSGPPHEQLFKVSCAVPEMELHGEGVASSRRAAEQAAAAMVLDLLDANGGE